MGQPFAVALQEHVYWASVQFVATLLLLAPSIAVAFICASAEKRTRTRSVLFIVAVAMLTLFYFYFQGHQSAQRAVLQKMWTAATVSVGLLPFIIGIPVVVVTPGAGALAGSLIAECLLRVESRH